VRRGDRVRQTVAVLGGGVDGWTAAAALASRLPRDRYCVLVAHAGADATEGFGPIATLPPALDAFHAGLGLDVNALVRAAGGARTCGTALSGWRADGADSFLPYGAVGQPMEGVPFHQLTGRLRAGGRAVRLADYSAAALAAQAGRDASRALPTAIHLPAAAYAGMLRATALHHGAEEAGEVAEVTEAEGVVTALRLADGTTVASPLLVIDAAGDGGEWLDWSRLLPCDRWRASVEPAALPPPYAHLVAEAEGWDAAWPLAGGIARLSVWQGGEGTRFRQGRRARAWTGNRVAVGAAYCTLEPLHPLAPVLLVRQVARLIRLLPADPSAPAAAAEHDRRCAEEADRARDAVAGHHAAATRRGRWWDARRAGPLPEPLAAKLSLFDARGRVALGDGEPWEEEDWCALLDALGREPRAHDALADRFPAAQVEAHFRAARERAIDAVRAMPPLAGGRA